MQKTLIAVIILAVVGTGLYYVLTSYQPSEGTLSELTQQEERPSENESGVEREVQGTIVSINTEQAMADGPILILVQQSTGEPAVIAVPSMGLPTCAARARMADAYTLTPGQFLEVRGSVDAEGMIVPCESAEHYLRVVEPI